MSQAVEALSVQASKLPPEERMEMVERILDSLVPPDALLDAQWAKEAEDRLNAYRRGGIKSVTLSEALARYQVDAKPI